MLKNQTKGGYFYLFYDPVSFWKGISENDTGVFFRKGVITFVILLVASALCGITGRYIYSISVPELIDFLPEAISNLLTPIITLLVLIILSHFLLRKKDGYKFKLSVVLSSYSLIPYLIVSLIILLVRDLFFFGMLSFYSVYVYAEGYRILSNSSRKKVIWFTVFVLLISFAVHFFTDLFLRYLSVNFILNA